MTLSLPAASVRIAATAAARAATFGRFADARRHLRAAARIDPADATTRFHLGRAYELDPFGSDELAAKHYRAAVKRARTNARYRAAFGRAAVRAGDRVGGVKALIRAVRLAPADVAVLAVVVDGLLDAGRVRTARRIVGRARFLARTNPTLLSLWNRVRFAEARAAQETCRPAKVLPFVRLVAGRTAPADGRIVRKDPPQRPRPHFGRVAVRRFRG